MNELKKAALVVLGADWLFNDGKLSMFLIDKFTEILKSHYACKRQDILIESQPNCYELMLK